MKVVFVACAKLEKTLSICYWLAIKKISQTYYEIQVLHIKWILTYTEYV